MLSTMVKIGWPIQSEKAATTVIGMPWIQDGITETERDRPGMVKLAGL